MHFWKVQALTYLTGAWSYRWHAVGIAWIICFAGWGAVAALPDQYSSEAKVYIDTDSLMTPLLKGIAVSSDSQAQIALMLKTFISRPNLEQVVRLSDPRGETYTRAELEQQVTNLERKINVRSLGTRNYYGIAFSDNNSQYAQSVTQSLISILMDSNIGDKRRDIEGARTFLDRQVAEYENRLREADQRRADFKSNNLEILGRGASSARLDGANSGVNGAKNELAVAIARRDSVQAQLASTPATVPGNDPIFLTRAAREAFGGGEREARSGPAQRVQLGKQQLSEMLLKYTDQHPDVIALKKTIADLESQISPPTDPESPAAQSPGVPNPVYVQLKAKLADEETNVAVQRQRLGAAMAEIEDAKRSTSKTIDIQTKYAELDRDYGSIERTYQSLLQGREAARMSQAVDDQAQAFAFRVVEAPQRALFPSGPNRPLFNSLVLLAGFAGGLAAAVFLSLLSGRINASDDLVAEFGVPVIGVITKLRKADDRRQLQISAATLSASIALLLICYVGVIGVLRTSIYSVLGA